jgi:HAMP domain-containing protein
LTQAFFIQLAASGAAVAAMVGLAAWASIARPTPPLDEERARHELAEEFPGRNLEDVWVALDGMGAVAKSGAMALVLCRHGDGFVARQIPWAQALATSFKDGHIRIDLADAAAPRAVIALESWPPKGGKKDLAGTVRAA